MTKDEYTKLKVQIEKETAQKLSQLNTKCALSNNPYKVGYKVTDHIGTVRIDKIKVAEGYFGALPYCTYYGLELKKNGESKKNMAYRGVYQTNIKE